MSAESAASRKQTNTYIMDPESASEMTRLLLQDRLVTGAMGGLFPGELDLARIHAVLDVACGPGGWVLDVAQQYPGIQATGIDINRMMVEFGQAQADSLGLANAHFRAMDATGPFKFPDASFDLVNARLLFGFMVPASWPRLVAECLRLLRPGGVVRLTECEAAITNSPAFERLADALGQALRRAGQSFSPDGRTIGITPMLSRFLREAGCQQLTHASYAIDWSFGTEAHESTAQNFFVGLELVQPFLVKMGALSEEEFERVSQQAIAELHSPEFCAIWYYLAAWGEKSAAQG
jgi:ubiquinone/menaquinone biosynthesis C-methylase UbiE